jgi:DNA-binding MarR family transcriptional regulator
MDTQIASTSSENFSVCGALRSAARAATQLFDLVLQPTGLKATQFIMLHAIERDGELPQWRLARQHAVAVETLSRRLAVLRRKGLVCVRTGRNHGEHIYSLTAQGRLALTRAVPFWNRAQERLRRTLGHDEIQVLMRICEKTVAATQEAEQLRTKNAVVPVSTEQGDSEAEHVTLRSAAAGSAVPRSGATLESAKSLPQTASQ